MKTRNETKNKLFILTSITFGIFLLMILITIMPVRASFSSTYVPSNYFEKVSIEGSLPLGENTSWDNVILDTSELIIINESVWYKDYDGIKDHIGINFISYSNNSQAIIDDIKSEFELLGVENIQTKTYEVPTIELAPGEEITFKIHLQNQGDETSEYKVEVNKGHEFVENDLKGTYEVPPDTTGNEFPVEIKLQAPTNSKVGTFTDFHYQVSEVKKTASNGSFVPTTPFIKKYKIFVLGDEQPEEVLVPEIKKKSSLEDLIKDNKYVLGGIVILITLFFLAKRKVRGG